MTKQIHRYWFENPRVAKPYHENAVGDEARLFPRDCREGVSDGRTDGLTGHGDTPPQHASGPNPRHRAGTAVHSVHAAYTPDKQAPLLLLLLRCCWVLQGASYKGALSLDLCWDIHGLPGTLQVLQKRVGSLPIMVKSTACHLHGEQPTGCSSQQPRAAVWLD